LRPSPCGVRRGLRGSPATSCGMSAGCFVVSLGNDRGPARDAVVVLVAAVGI
jgi:hypothetical protein